MVNLNIGTTYTLEMIEPVILGGILHKARVLSILVYSEAIKFPGSNVASTHRQIATHLQNGTIFNSDPTSTIYYLLETPVNPRLVLGHSWISNSTIFESIVGTFKVGDMSLNQSKAILDALSLLGHNNVTFSTSPGA